MNLQKCACVRINDSKEIRRYLKKKREREEEEGLKTRCKLVCCDASG